MHTFDVVVVGAGPAGSAAACHLAGMDKRVLLVDKSAFPREKACGDALTHRARALLSALGIDDRELRGREITGFRLQVIGGQREDYLYRDDRGGLVIARAELDNCIRERAGALGATLWDNALVTKCSEVADFCQVRIRVGAATRVVTTRYVVIADGGRSHMSRSRFEPDASAGDGIAVRAYFTNVGELDGLFRVYVPLRCPGNGERLAGYGWVFPMVGGQANVGVGRFGGAHSGIQTIFRRFVATLRQQEPVLADMKQVGQLKGATVPARPAQRAVIGGSVILVGDAAGLVDPFTGEGIANALESAELAASTIDGAMKGAHGIDRYQKLIDQRFSERRELGKRFVRSMAFCWRVLEGTVPTGGSMLRRVRRSMIDFGGYARSIDSNSLWQGADDVAGAARRIGLAVDRICSDGFAFAAEALSGVGPRADRSERVGAVHLLSKRSSTTSAMCERAALCIELAHEAWMMHRETLDRRGSAGGSGVRWANRFVVMLGDYLLVHCLDYGRELPRTVREAFFLAHQRICSGQARRDNVVSCPGDRPKAWRYVRYACGAEAAFSGMAFEMGARLGGLPDVVCRALRRAGCLGAVSQRLQADAAELEESEEEEWCDVLATRATSGRWSYPMAWGVGEGIVDLAECAESRGIGRATRRALLEAGVHKEARRLADRTRERAIRVARRHCSEELCLSLFPP